jgi:hypothetical protein
MPRQAGVGDRGSGAQRLDPHTVGCDLPDPVRFFGQRVSALRNRARSPPRSVGEHDLPQRRFREAGALRTVGPRRVGSRRRSARGHTAGERGGRGRTRGRPPMPGDAARADRDGTLAQALVEREPGATRSRSVGRGREGSGRSVASQPRSIGVRDDSSCGNALSRAVSLVLTGSHRGEHRLPCRAPVGGLTLSGCEGCNG